MKVNLPLQDINETYNLSNGRMVSRVGEGKISQAFILEDDHRRYFLKRYEDEATRVAEIYGAEEYFAEQGLPVILPVMTKDHHSYMVNQDGCWVLYPFIEATMVARQNLTEGQIAQLGTVLAKLHLAGRREEAPRLRRREKPLDSQSFGSTLQAIEEKMNTRPVADQADQAARDLVRLKQRIVEQNEVERHEFRLKDDHLVHGDFHEGNVFFSEDDKIIHIFDFDDTLISPRVYELIRAMIYISTPEQFDQTSMTKMKLLLNAYQMVYPIEAEELQQGLEFFYLNKAHSLRLETEYFVKSNQRVAVFFAGQLSFMQYLNQHRSDLLELLTR